ncbi:ABC transporter permease subunit [Stygiolobus caldivivus]|uniref:ABC transporter permease n=1 Tax=Stygiolobus caldivivus TaxID=2824673 RepID=A0A8D5ZKE9_9CREN|nr:ABC transporter permease subunit [Stygiolobus caldivivus]BCU71671.1 hypothetical protein KN1_29680 [Stygiolobus caldivivus]
MRANIYDLKRSLMRVSTLFVIILFSIISAAFAVQFFTHNPFGQTLYGGYPYQGVNLIGIATSHYYPSNSTFLITVYGYAFNNQGQPISGTVEVKVLGPNNAQYVKSISVDGVFNASFCFKVPPAPSSPAPPGTPIYFGNQISGTGFQPSPPIIPYPSYILVLSSGGVNRMQQFFNTNSTSPVIATSEVCYTSASISGDKSLAFVQMGKAIALSNANGVVKVVFYNQKKVLGEQTFSVVAYKVKELDINAPYNTTAVKVFFGNSSKVSGYYQYTELGNNLMSYFYSLVFLLLEILLPLFVIYLGYSYFAEPRGRGSLEFILSRPVTKTDIYVNRYIANVVTVGVASFVLVAVFYLVVYFYSQYMVPLYVIVLNWLGLFLLLTTYLSIVYFTGGLFKSSNYTILIGGLSFLIDSFLFQIMGFMPKYYFIKYYVQFASVNEAIKHYIMLQGDSFSVPLSLLASLSWVFIPFLLGLLAFKKRDI